MKKYIAAFLIFLSVNAHCQNGFVISPTHTQGSAVTIAVTLSNDTSLHDTLAQIYISGTITYDFINKIVVINPALFTSIAAYNQGHPVSNFGLLSLYNVPVDGVSYSPASWPPTLAQIIIYFKSVYTGKGYKINSTF